MLENPANLDPASQEILLNEIDIVFTDSDNLTLENPPTFEEVYSTLKASNLSAATGTDRITGLLYKECWSSLGTVLTEIMREMFTGESPTVSMRTVLMVFSCKPKRFLPSNPPIRGACRF